MVSIQVVPPAQVGPSPVVAKQYNSRILIIDNSPQPSGLVSGQQPPRSNPIIDLLNQIIAFTAITAGAGLIFRSFGRLKEHIIANRLHERPLGEWPAAIRTRFNELVELATNPSSNGKVNLGNLSLSDLTNPQKLKDIGAQTAEAIKDRFNSLFGTSTERISNAKFSQAVSDHPYSKISQDILRGLEIAGNDRAKLREFAESLSADLQRVALDKHPQWESKIGKDLAADPQTAIKDYFNGSDNDASVSKDRLKQLALELNNIATSVVSNNLQSKLAAEVVKKQIDHKDVPDNMGSKLTQIFQSLFKGELKIGDIQQRVASDFKGVKEDLQVKLAQILANTAERIIPASA